MPLHFRRLACFAVLLLAVLPVMAQPLSFVDINPGTANSAPTNFVVFDGALYFAADDDTHGNELWRTDGTEAGTVRVADIRPGSEGSRPEYFAVFDSALFFHRTYAVEPSAPLGGAVAQRLGG